MSSIRLRAAEVAREVGFSEDFINAVIFSADCWNECIQKAWESDPEKTKKGLAILATDIGISEGNRFSISRSKYAPAEVLKKMADDLNALVRVGVAMNPNTPSHILVQLAKKGSFAIRLAVAQNSNAPLSALEVLQNDPDPQISNRAKTRLNKFRLNSSLY